MVDRRELWEAIIEVVVAPDQRLVRILSMRIIAEWSHILAGLVMRGKN